MKKKKKLVLHIFIAMQFIGAMCLFLATGLFIAHQISLLVGNSIVFVVLMTANVFTGFLVGDELGNYFIKKYKEWL